MIVLPEMDTKERLEAGFVPVMETFYSIQGEGAHQGRAAFFIRLAGCDVGCSWCDVKESWPVGDDQWVSIDSLVEKVQEHQPPIVVVTGGEPLMYECSKLTQRLAITGASLHLETSGAYPLTGNWDWICVSPKRNKLPLEGSLKAAHELKQVIYHRNDLRLAEQYAKETRPSCALYLQPEWSVRENIMPLIFDYVRQHPKWRISLQVHKYLGVD